MAIRKRFDSQHIKKGLRIFFINICLIFCVLFSTITVAQNPSQKQKHIRVGISNDPPVQEFVNGKATGIFPKLLAVIAKENNWEIEYVYGTWDEVYNKLLSGEIDLLSDIWHITKREALIDFSKESVLNVWGQVFIDEDSKIKQLNDLKDKTIGIMRNDASGIVFKKIISNFGINPTFIEYPNYEVLAKAIEQKKIDAGVSNNLAGFKLIKKYFIKKSNIVFSPNSLVFATKKGLNNDLLTTIDKTLTAWKADRNSFYYNEVDVWIDKLPENTFDYKLLINVVGILSLMIIIGLIWVFTLRKQVAKAYNQFEKSQQKLILSQKSAGIAFLFWNLKTNLIETSPEINKLFGLNETKANMSGDFIKNVVYPDDVNKVNKALQKTLTKHIPYNIEHRNIRPSDGSVFWVHAIADISYDEKGNPEELVGTVIDITSIKTAEAEILDNQNRLKRAEMVAQIGNWVLDMSTKRIILSDGAKFITGYANNEISLKEFKTSVIEIDIQKFENALDDLLLNKKSLDVEIRFNHIETDAVLNLLNHGIYDDETKKVYAVLQDVSEKRKLERAFISAFIEAQEVEKQSFGEELHDGISQILAAEAMFVDVLMRLDKKDDKKITGFLAKVRALNLSATNEARNIAHGLMSKQLKEHGLLFAMAQICKDYNSSKSINFSFSSKDINESEIAKEIQTNIFRISQEISTNIVHHSLAKKAFVSLTKKDKNILRLEIKDNGIGIDFDKIKRDNKGAGLKNIERRVSLLNGKLTIDTAPNKGTYYLIEVPLVGF